MKYILTLLITLLAVAVACRAPPTPFVKPDVHRLGWGLDDDYIPGKMEQQDYQAIKPVKRRVVKHEKMKGEPQPESKPLLWGITKLSELDDIMTE